MTEQANGSNKVENVIIIGSGPAGYTAALYTSRADLEPLIFEGFHSRRSDMRNRQRGNGIFFSADLRSDEDSEFAGSPTDCN